MSKAGRGDADATTLDIQMHHYWYTLTSSTIYKVYILACYSKRSFSLVDSATHIILNADFEACCCKNAC